MANDTMPPEIALTWQLGSNFGWGLYGIQIALQLTNSGRGRPILLSAIRPHKGDPIEREALHRIWLHQRKTIEGMQSRCVPDSRVDIRVPVLTALGNNCSRQFLWPSFDYNGTENHGLVFLENTLVTDDARDRFNNHDTVTAGSTWARDLLRANGVYKTEACIQGVDPTFFCPGPKRAHLKDRFTIFAGGKIEYRKGQDIVLEVARRFREHHPELLLLCVWDNPWLNGDFFGLLDHSPYYPNMLDHVTDDGLHWERLLMDVGLPLNAVRIFGAIENHMLPLIMRDADVALFPNRCEGGTNMMAMQTMACGIPTILSANTGHMDIIADGGCLPLTRQSPVEIDRPKIDAEGWGESDVEEILANLEFVYQDRKAARALGLVGAAFMGEFTWERQILKLANLIGL